MSVSSATRPSAGRARRAGAAAALVLLLVAPLLVIFVLFWRAKTADLTFSQNERRGVRYLGPLTDLLGTLTDQQSSVVHGRGVVAGAIDQSVAAVDAADQEVGGRLQTSQRWGQLRQQVLDLTGRADLTPADAFTEYSTVVDLTVQLIRKVGDTSNLILDPRIDAYYVMNATMLRLPEVLVSSGRYADLVTIVAAGGRPADPDALAQLASVRGQVLASADDLSAGLRKSFEATTSASLGPVLLRQLDDFRSAVDTLAPRISPIRGVPVARLDPEKVESDQGDVQRVSLALDVAGLDQLDVLLKARVDAATRQRQYGLAALVSGVLLSTVLLLPWRGRGRRRGHDAPRPGRTRRPAASPAARPAARPATGSVDTRELAPTSRTAPSAPRGGVRAAR